MMIVLQIILIMIGYALISCVTAFIIGYLDKEADEAVVVLLSSVWPIGLPMHIFLSILFWWLNLILSIGKYGRKMFKSQNESEIDKCKRFLRENGIDVK